MGLSPTIPDDRVDAHVDDVPMQAVVTRAEAARLLKVSMQTIDRALIAGHLQKAEWPGRRVGIVRSSLERFLKPATSSGVIGGATDTER